MSELVGGVLSILYIYLVQIVFVETNSDILARELLLCTKLLAWSRGAQSEPQLTS